MSEARELAERHVSSFNERAWSQAPELYAPDLVMVEPGGTIRGIEPFLEFERGFIGAMPDSRFEVTAVIESGNLAVVEGAYTGTHTGPLHTPQGEVPPTGRKMRLPLCDVTEVAAGRITQIRAYYDQMTFAAQLGLITGWPTRPISGWLGQIGTWRKAQEVIRCATRHTLPHSVRRRTVSVMKSPAGG
jgi:predicted ester cyclase